MRVPATGVERGDANPRLVTLAKIAHALGVTVPELLTDVRPPRQDARSAAHAGSAEPDGRGRRAG